MPDVRPEDIDGTLVPSRSPRVHTVEIDGEAVLLDEERNRLHMVNATGALVWACFDGVASVADIVTDISGELGVAHDEVLSDTLALTRHLGEQGLLANVETAADLDDRGSDVRLDGAVDDEDEECDDDVAEASAQADASPDDPRFVTQPPNP